MEKYGTKKSKERREEPLGTMSYQTSSKRSPPFWLLIGARKLVFFWHQSEARTAATVGTGLVRHCPQGLFSPFFTRSLLFTLLARVRQSSVTSNTLWASVNFFGQITVQRYVVFVPTVELRTLYIQKLPYMNTFGECILKKIGPTHAHFHYNARKLMSLKSVLL